jgi:tRNA(Arg) A34 adenosine deaminase TadA
MSNKKQIILAKCYDKKNRLLSVAYNSYLCTHPVQAYFAKKVGMPERVFLHAEICAILRAKGKKIHKISVERYSKDGTPLLAAPCPICAEAIRAFGINEVSYTVEGTHDRHRITFD